MGKKGYILYLLLYTFPVKFISIKTGLKLQTESYNHLSPPSHPKILSDEKKKLYQNVQETGWGRDYNMQASVQSRCFDQTWDPLGQKDRLQSLPQARSLLCKARFMILLPAPLTR